MWGYIPGKGNFLYKLIGHPHPNGRLRARVVMKFIENKKTLDIGCGEGIFLGELAKRGIDVKGVDIDKQALEKAKDNFRRLNVKVDVKKSSADKIPFKNESFEQIICLDVLEHVKNPNNVISEINRILRKNGKVIISVPNELYLIKTILPFNFSEQLKVIGHNNKGFYYGDIKTILEKNGFKVLRYKYYHKWFSRFITELIYGLAGKKGMKKGRKKMYKHSLSSMFVFLIIYGIMQLDVLLPFSKGGFVAVKAEKI